MPRPLGHSDSGTTPNPSASSVCASRSRAKGLDRNRILDATDMILNAEGYDATTIRRIAKELGCAVGSIYRYFSDKRDLLSVVTQRRFEPVVMRIELGAPIEKTMSAYLDAAREQPEQYRLMYWLAAVGRRDDTAAVPDMVQRIIDGWGRQLHDANRAWQIWAELHGCVMLGLGESRTRAVIEELSLLTLPLVAEIPPDFGGVPISGFQSRVRDLQPDEPEVVEYADELDIVDEAHRVFTVARNLADAMAMFDRRNIQRSVMDLDEE